MGLMRLRVPMVLAGGAFVLLWIPVLGAPAFYVSFLYLIFFWIALATSWGLLSGFSGYWSFGHGAFFGTGVYTTATLAGRFGVSLIVTIPIGALIAAIMALAIGWVVFRTRLKGELFALITLAVTYILATIASNTPIDGGLGVYLSNVPVPRLLGSPDGLIYVLGLGLATGSLLVSYGISRGRFGLGLFAIHDDEEVAEVKGVPCLRYKLVAFATSSAIAGAVGSVHAVYVGYITVGETFSVTIPLYVVLMSILGGARSWLGPAVGAVLITVALNLFTGASQAEIGRAGVALGLVIVILLLPAGVVPNVLRRCRRRMPEPIGMTASAEAARERRPISATARTRAGDGDAGESGAPLLACRGLVKTFDGIRALQGVTLDLREGEILGLVGPNGSGKSTLINVISGHYRLDGGTIELGGLPIEGRPAHEVARLGIARTYQIPRPFNHLTVFDNVMLCAAFREQASSADLADEVRHWLAFAGLSGKMADLPTQLNLHERKFLELARALAARPRILMLDEVLAGLNPSEIDGATALVREIRAAGTSIIFVEHLMRAVLDLSDRIAVLDQGSVLAIGPPRETMRDPRVVRAYLGASHVT